MQSNAASSNRCIGERPPKNCAILSPAADMYAIKDERCFPYAAFASSEIRTSASSVSRANFNLAATSISRAIASL
jgi:hypothetical protein